MIRSGPAESCSSPSSGSVRPFFRRPLAILVAGSAADAHLRQYPFSPQTYFILLPSPSYIGTPIQIVESDQELKSRLSRRGTRELRRTLITSRITSCLWRLALCVT